MDHVTARAFVDSWVTAWNAHDLDAVLTHFADDVTFRSPVAIQLLGGDGVIRGKDTLRAYWAEAFGATWCPPREQPVAASAGRFGRLLGVVAAVCWCNGWAARAVCA